MLEDIHLDAKNNEDAAKLRNSYFFLTVLFLFVSFFN